MKMKNGLKLPVTMKEYEATQIQYPANLDVYRSAPDEQNRLHDFSCLTIMIRHNTDLRNYLIIEAGNNPKRAMPATQFIDDMNRPICYR
jgi:hypothetical protein